MDIHFEYTIKCTMFIKTFVIFRDSIHAIVIKWCCR